jgi:hypothetical protein
LLVLWLLEKTVRDSTYAVIDSGYKYMYDRYNNVYRYVPLNGDIAGLCARKTSLTIHGGRLLALAVVKLKTLLNCVGILHRLTAMFFMPIQLIQYVSFPGQGTVLYGDKTATMHPSAFDRINVRRLFITLEKAVSRASQYSLFQFNDAFTRSQFVNLVTPLLRNIQGSRGITEFLVVCDDTNNPSVSRCKSICW